MIASTRTSILIVAGHATTVNFIGNAVLARVVGQVAVAALVKRMPQMRLAEDLRESPLHLSLFRGSARVALRY